MKLWLKFGLLNAMFGLLVGIHVTYFTIHEGDYSFVFVAPISAFATAVFFWKIFFKEDTVLENGKIILLGVLTGSLSHFVAYIFLSFGLNICYWTTGACTGPAGEAPAGILTLLSGGIILSFFSLLFYGWITVPISISIGFLIKHFESKKADNTISID
jgi:uncharacterized membrane protein